MRIAAIETRRYRYPLDPPFSAAWDPEPRTHQDATSCRPLRCRCRGLRERRCGLPDRELLERLLVGLDLDATDTVHGSSRPSTSIMDEAGSLEVAVWDLLGRAQDQPFWQLLGGGEDRHRRLRIERRARVRRRARTPLPGPARRGHARDRNSASTRRDWRVDLPVIEAVRETSLRLGAHGRRQPGLAHAGRSHSALGH